MSSRLSWLVKQQGGTCVLCGNAMPAPSTEHLLPQALGGDNRLENLAAACCGCNSSRGCTRLTEAQINRVRAFYRREVAPNGVFLRWTDGAVPPSFFEASRRWPGASRPSRKQRRTRRQEMKAQWRARREQARAAMKPIEVMQAPVDYDPWEHDLYD